MLAEDLDLVHISVGDIFRWNVQHHTKMGAQVRRIMAAGELVGDDLVEAVAADRLAEHDWNFGFVIDGFPRNASAGRFLPGELRHRRGHPPRHARQRGPPPGAGPAAVLRLRHGLQPHRQGRPTERASATCAAASLVTREDDTEEALAVRLRDYHEKTDPVLDIFRRKEYVATSMHRPGKDEVQQAIRAKLGLPPSSRNAAAGWAASRRAGADRARLVQGQHRRRRRGGRAGRGWRRARPGDQVTRACRWPTAVRAP